MDTRDGRIYTPEKIEKMQRDMIDTQNFIAMALNPTPRQMARTPPRVGMYEPCPCGSGQKFKWCCYHKNDRSVKTCTSTSYSNY